MGDNQAIFLAGARVFTGTEERSGQGLLIRDGIISAFLPSEHTPKDARRIELQGDSLIAPGLVDAQVNGAGGVLFNDEPNEKAARHISVIMKSFGVTSFLPTLITDTYEKMVLAAETVLNLVEDPNSGVVGLHLEGPFINPDKRGCHNADLIRLPEERDLHLLENTARGLRKKGGCLLLTVAPEVMPVDAAIRLSRSGAVLSAGHSEASYTDMHKACSHGFSGFTHLGNAMSPVSGRDPGLLGASLLSAPGCWGSLIADGIHIHQDLIKLFLQQAGKGGCQPFLVSDSMPATGSDNATFCLYGNQVFRRNGRLETADGTLAGADTNLLRCVHNVIRMTGIHYEEALRMASLYPCRFLGLEQNIGSLEKGKKADIVVLSRDLDILGTCVNGVYTSLEHTRNNG